MQNRPYDIFSEIINAKAQGTPLVMVTVVQADGSSPQKSGARMLVYADGRTGGTIGGGAIEQMAIRDALTLMQHNEPVLRAYNLGQDAGMMCGGRMTLFYEPVLPALPLYIFGGGHIGSALCRILQGAGFAITVVDNRAEFSESARFADGTKTIHAPYDQALQDISLTEQTAVIIVTHGHAHDQEILAYCIKHPLLYLGMIGSKSKVEKTRQLLMQQGVTDEQWSQVHSPIGLPIGGSSPTEIAISIAAELIAVKNKKTDIPESSSQTRPDNS